MLITSIGLSQKNKWDFSVNASSAISWAKMSGDIKPDGVGFAFDFSAYAEKYLRKNFAYYIGISFIQVSGKLQNISPEDIRFKSADLYLMTGQSTKYFAQYLTIPVGIKLQTRQYGRFFYYWQGGLLPGLKINGTLVIDKDKYSMFKDLNLMTCAVQLSSGLLYPIGENTFVKAGVIFEHFFTDTFNASNMKVLPFIAGLQAGFVF
jgi:hypothetical protein